ncbi:MAG: hypothetical protein J5911_04580 [Clostridia bacterium]|nr:hypothetical protein [Clostridia bacterium]
MKKSLIALITATLLSCAFLGGCACSGEKQLSFNLAPEKETLKYTVKYSEDYIDSYKKDPTLNFDFQYGTGNYFSSCQKLSDRSDIKSDISELLNDKDIYELTTGFSIDLTFTYKGKEYTRTETVNTKAYIAPTALSLAPIYSEENSEYAIFSADSSDIMVTVLRTRTEILYDQDNYSMIKKYQIFDVETATDFTDAAKTSEYNGKYSFRSVIDNTELFFAMRDIAATLSEKSSADIPVVSPSFNDPTHVKITNGGKSVDDFTIKYNGTEITEAISYYDLYYRLSSVNASGIAQHLFVQTGESTTIPDLKLPLKFAKPLYQYGNIKSMGCLVFTLSEIER